MDEIVCKIEWTKQDIYDAFIEKHHRIPSDIELIQCIKNINPISLQDRSIEFGWSFIYDAVIGMKI